MYLFSSPDIMKIKFNAMKTFAAFVLFLAAVKISAQPVTVSADVQYRVDTVAAQSKTPAFFLTAISDSLTNPEKNLLMEIAVNKILQKTNRGDSVELFNPVLVDHAFSTGMAIRNCEKINPFMFQLSANSIGEQPWDRPNGSDYFKKSGTMVKSENLLIDVNKKIILYTDTMMTVDKKGNMSKTLELVRYYMEPEYAAPYFIENWNFDPTSGRFVKNVKYFGFYYLRKPNSDYRDPFYYPVFMLANSAPATGDHSKYLPVKKNVVCDVAIHRPEQMLANDTSFARYAGPDAVEYMGLSDGNIPEGDRAKMLAAIFSYALANPGNVSPEQNAKADTLHAMKNANEVLEHFIYRDTVMIDDPMNPGVFITRVVAEEKTLADVYALRFYEDWCYDPATFTVKKYVRGIGFILLEMDNNGLPQMVDAGIYVKVKSDY